jgi:predicted phage tail protein
VVRDDRYIDLSWGTAPRATTYRVEFGREPGQTVVSAQLTGVRSTFDLTTVGGGTYYVRVRALTNTTVAGQSTEVIVNVAAASSAPLAFAATMAGRNAQLSWQPPADGLGALSYQVEVGTTSGAANVAQILVPGLSTVLQDLPDGAYFLRVRAVRSSGPGEASSEATLNMSAGALSCGEVPGAPTEFVGTAQGSLVTLSWRPGAGAPPTSYRLLVGSATGQQDLMTIPLGSNTSLKATAGNGVYYLRLLAVNACGVSAWGADAVLAVGPQSALPAGASSESASLPGAPEGLNVTVTGSTVTLSWESPATGGAPTRYIVEAMTAGGPVAVDTGHPGRTFTHDNTPAGTYTVQVRAANAAGAGPASSSVTVVVP